VSTTLSPNRRLSHRLFAMAAASTAGVLAVEASAAPITVSFQDGSEFVTDLGMMGANSVQLTDEPSVQITVTAASLSDGTPLLSEGGGGASSGTGVNSKGASSANNGTAIELVGNAQTLDETINLLFADGSGNPVPVTLLSFEASLAKDGDIIEVTLGGGSPLTFNGSGNNNAAQAFNFAPNTTLAAGDTLAFSAGAGNYRLASLTFEVVPEPATLALTAAGLGLLVSRRRNA